MAKNESLVPEGELERLKQLDVEIMNAANSMEKMLAKIQMYATAFSKTNVPYKEFLEITKEFNTVCDESKKKTEDFSKAAKEQEDIRKKNIESASKEVEAIKQVNEAYSTQSKTLKDISKEAYARVSKEIDGQRKNLVALQSELKRTQKEIKNLDEQRKNNLITYDNYISKKSVLIAKEQDQKAVVKQVSDTIKFNNNIISTSIGSYDNLSAQYSRLKIQINQMSEAEKFNGYTKKELEAQAKALYEEMSRLQKETGKSQLDVGKYDKAVGDLTTTLRMLDPTLGTIVGRVQQITPLKKAWITTNEKLQKSLNVTARSATILQAAVTGLIVGAIYLAYEAYKSWREEQDKLAESQKELASNMASSLSPQILTIKKLQSGWNDLGDSLKEKEEFVKKNKSAFDSLGVSVTNVNDAENILVKNTDKFINALKLRAQIAAAEKVATDHYAKAVEAREEGRRLLVKEEGIIFQDYRNKGVKKFKEEQEHVKAGNALFEDNIKKRKEYTKLLSSLGIAEFDSSNKNNDRDKTKDNELKAAHELIEYRMQQEVEAQKKLLENNQKSYDERMKAANDFEERMGELIEQKRKHQLSQEGLTPSQILLVNEKADVELNKISEEGGKIRENIWKDHISTQNKVIEQGLEERNQILSDNEQSEKQRLLQELQSGEISKEEYEQQLTELTVTYSQARLQAEIEAIEKMLEVSGISEEERLALTQKLRKAELDFNKSILDQEVKNAFDAAKKKEEIEKQLAETKKKLAQEVYNFLGSLANSYTESQLNELETQQEQNDEWRDAEMQRIEEQEQKGVISKEQAEAQKWAIDEQSKQNEKKIEEEKKKVLERQAKFEKAASLVKVAMDTAKGVTAAMALMPLTAGQPFVSMILAMGAMQAAAIMAQPIPKYKHGTDDHRGGLAVVGDGGRHEMIVLPSGDIWKTPHTDTLVDLPKGTQVLPDFSKALVNMSVLRSADETKPIVIQEHREVVSSMNKNNKLLKNMALSQHKLAKQLIRQQSNPFDLIR